MQIDHVYALYFSPTGNTALAARTVAHKLAERFDAPCSDCLLYTSPSPRD